MADEKRERTRMADKGKGVGARVRKKKTGASITLGEEISEWLANVATKERRSISGQVEVLVEELLEERYPKMKPGYVEPPAQPESVAVTGAQQTGAAPEA